MYELFGVNSDDPEGNECVICMSDDSVRWRQYGNFLNINIYLSLVSTDNNLVALPTYVFVQ